METARSAPEGGRVAGEHGLNTLSVAISLFPMQKQIAQLNVLLAQWHTEHKKHTTDVTHMFFRVFSHAAILEMVCLFFKL